MSGGAGMDAGRSMKLLWICNLVLPEIAQRLGWFSIPKEGWIEGLLDGLLRAALRWGTGGSPVGNGRRELSLSIAFPVARELDGCSGSIEPAGCPGQRIAYYGFGEDTVHPERYDPALEERIAAVLQKAAPDVVHCFGTEFPHTLAAARVLAGMRDPGGASGRGNAGTRGRAANLLISIQGPCTVYAERYLAHLPEAVYRSRTVRDILRRDSILEQQEKFRLRGDHEREAVALAGHLAGRTEFDRGLCAEWNPDAVYHHAGESLRRVFYENVGAWKWGGGKRHRIFVSQADYPLKGFHDLLLAAAGFLAEDPETYGDLEICVAGQSIVNARTVKERLKLPAYGRYLRSLMREYHLEERVHILGRLSAEEMKARYLSCGVYVCASACENSPNSLGEAMMLGVPCVAADVGGISSLFVDGEDGWLYRNRPEDSPKEAARNLREALAAAWSDPEEAARRGRNAAAHALRNHDRERNAAELLEIYRGICG